MPCNTSIGGAEGKVNSDRRKRERFTITEGEKSIEIAETASNGRHARGDCLVSDDGRSGQNCTKEKHSRRAVHTIKKR